MTTLFTIAAELKQVSPVSFFGYAIRISVEKDLLGVIAMIKGQAVDNRKSVAGIIGEELLKQIEAL